MSKDKELSIRLQAVYDALPDKSLRFIDVGSDHGLLALEVLEGDKASGVICTDIHKAPAERTRLCLAGAGFESRSEVYCTDGLKGVSLMPGDSVAIAGMGGNTIIDIIEAAMNENDISVFSEITWCLQPQKSIDLLRKFLGSRGFEFIDEIVCIDRDLHYVIIKTKYTGVVREVTSEEAYYGVVLPNKANLLEVNSYYSHLEEVYKLRSRGDKELAALLEERNDKNQ